MADQDRDEGCSEEDDDDTYTESEEDSRKLSSRSSQALGRSSTTGEDRQKGQRRKRPIEATDPVRRGSKRSRASSDQGPSIIVNWNTLANRNSARSVLAHLPHQEVDNLVGWATHLTHDGQGNSSGGGTPTSTISADQQSMEGNSLMAGESPFPPPPSYLDFIKEKARAYVTKNESSSKSKSSMDEDPIPKLWETFDTSAVVAMGRILQDMVTANLLPLAELHVKRCRQLEENKDLLDSNQLHVNAFQEWTLPPEEAIANLRSSLLLDVQSSDPPPPSTEGESNQGIPLHACLPSTSPPSRVMLPPRSVLTNEQLAAAKTTSNHRTAAEFCQRHELHPKFARRNMDLYELFLPASPPETLDHTVKIPRRLKES